MILVSIKTDANVIQKFSLQRDNPFVKFDKILSTYGHSIYLSLKIFPLTINDGILLLNNYLEHL